MSSQYQLSTARMGLTRTRAILCLLPGLVLFLFHQCKGHESKQLLKYDNLTKKFLLDQDALNELASLRTPIRIIAAIGDARVGKSTSLNIMRHIWKGESRPVEQVFETSNEMAACTRGVWISVLLSPDDTGSVVFLDVEGSNLGDDTKTNQFSIFATLLSSSLMLFAEEAVTNHNRDFLFRVTRLTEEIWRDQLRDAAFNHFPDLRVVLRQSLDPPEGVTLEKFIVNSVYGVKDDKSEILRKYFSNNKLTVSTISFNKELQKRAGHSDALSHNAYKKDVTSLVDSMKNTPFKETIHGAKMNGKMTQELAQKLVEALNKDSWVLFSDTYTMMEKSLCDDAFDSLIAPLQHLGYPSIVHKKHGVLEGFSKQCVLEAEKRRAEGWIGDVIDGKQKAEEKERQAKEQRRRKEEEERRQREIEAERRREEERQRRRMEQERQNREAAERRRREEEERARRAEEARQQARRNLEEIERAKRKAKKKKNDIVKVIGVIAGVAALVFSDENLKQNITTIPDSKYEMIGLRGVTWVWNERAQALGMRGRGQGVIAQEVEKVYPQAVIVEGDGYKRVYYSFLDNLLVDKKLD